MNPNYRPLDTKINTMRYEMENYPESVELNEITDLIKDVNALDDGNKLYDKVNILEELDGYKKKKENQTGGSRRKKRRKKSRRVKRKSRR